MYLTIDANVQAITEQSLRDELVNAHNRRNKDGSYNAAPAGASVILDPNNGQVIAMASYPDYDPAEFTKPIPSDRWAQLNDPNNFFPLNNRALQGEYAPGSTFKLVTALAGLAHGRHHAGDDGERHRHLPRARVHRRAVRRSRTQAAPATGR